MRLYTVTFGEDAAVVIEPGVALEDDKGHLVANLGTDVGGQTLAMIPFKIPVSIGPADAGFEAGAPPRVVSAEVFVSDEGKVSFTPESAYPDTRAFVVLSVMQRSPDARTEVVPYGKGVVCVGNAFDRPFDIQVLLLQPSSHVRFRRFSRGGNFGPWNVLEWDGKSLTCAASLERSE
jgi:hypothetical protein